MNKRSAWWHNSAYLRQLVKNGRIGVENQMFNGRTSNFQGTSSLCAVLWQLLCLWQWVFCGMKILLWNFCPLVWCKCHSLLLWILLSKVFCHILNGLAACAISFQTVWVGAASALQNVFLALSARIVHEAAQNTPNHITRSHSDDTSARHMHNMRWIEMIGINVGNGQEVCCDGLDTLESAVCKVAIMTFCHCNCGIHRRVGFFHRAGCSCSLEGTGYYLTTVPHISRSL